MLTPKVRPKEWEKEEGPPTVHVHESEKEGRHSRQSHHWSRPPPLGRTPTGDVRPCLPPPHSRWNRARLRQRESPPAMQPGPKQSERASSAQAEPSRYECGRWHFRETPKSWACGKCPQNHRACADSVRNQAAWRPSVPGDGPSSAVSRIPGDRRRFFLRVLLAEEATLRRRMPERDCQALSGSWRTSTSAREAAVLIAEAKA